MSQSNSGIKTWIAGEALAIHRRVKVDPADATKVIYADADDIAIGITKNAAANAEHVAVILRNVPGTRKVVAAGAFSAGDFLYGAADGKVDDDQSGGAAGEFEALEAATAANDVVEAIPLQAQNKSRLLYVNLADSAEVENTTTETAFDKSVTIDGAHLQIGDVIEVIAEANVVDNNSTDTLNLKLYVGTEEIVATGAVDVADADVGYIHAFIVVRAVGASGAVAATGVVGLGVEATVPAKPFRKAQATEDLSGSVAITVKATWSVAHADNEVELEELIVLHHRQ